MPTSQDHGVHVVDFAPSLSGTRTVPGSVTGQRCGRGSGACNLSKGHSELAGLVIGRWIASALCCVSED